jgi:signal transduction histidine kinase
MENATMTNGDENARWLKLLSLAVHEFRSPITVVNGYLKMVLNAKDSGLGDQQRRMLEDAARSCARLTAIVAEMSELGTLEAANAKFHRTPVDLRGILSEAAASLPPVPDREIAVTVATADKPAIVSADHARLKVALASVLTALRRELVTTTELLVRQEVRSSDGQSSAWIAIGDADAITTVAAAGPGGLVPFDEWRGGNGLSLVVARRVLNAHGGKIWSLADGTSAKSTAAIMLPLSSPQ